MSQRTVWSCDICGQDIPEDEARAVYGTPGITTMSAAVEFGACCIQRPIADLIEAFQVRSPKKVAPAVQPPATGTGTAAP